MQQRRSIADHVAQDAGDDGVQIQLRQRVGFALRIAPQDLVALDPHVVEMGGAAAGVLLADAVPVIEDPHALAVGGDQRAEGVAILATGRHQHPIGIQGAGAEVLGAVQAIAVAISQQGGLEGIVAHRLGRLLGEGVAEDLAGRRELQAGVAQRLGGCTQQLVDQQVVGAQDVRHIRVGLGQADEHLEQLAQAGAGAAACVRQAQGTQARRAHPIHGTPRMTFLARLAARRGILGNGRQ
ncbi:hypothetical protein D3C81_1050180 [compost metagenome]